MILNLKININNKKDPAKLTRDPILMMPLLVYHTWNTNKYLLGSHQLGEM